MMSAAMNQNANSFPINERGRIIDPAATEDQRTFGVMMHLSILAHMFIPLVAIAIPIIMWRSKSKTSPFLDDQGREAVNFHISLLIYSVGLPLVATLLGVITFGIGFVLLIPAIALPYILGLVGMILAVAATNRGEYYRYPMTLRFLHS